MKKIILFMLLLSACIRLNAQVRLQHLFGGAGYDDAQEVIQTPDGGFVTCGTTESFGAGLSDILVVKTNDSGIVQWSRAYGTPGNDFGSSIKRTPSGGYIIAGYSNGFSPDSTDDFLVIRISGGGNVLWSKTYGGAGNDEAHALTVMPDSGFIIAGTSASFGGGSNQDGFVVRTDADGNQLWSKAIKQNSDQQLFAVDATDEGGCIVAGYTYVSSFRLFDIFVSRINANGSKQWVKRIGGNNSEQAFSVKQSLTGGFVVSGYTASFGNGQDDAFILRLAENGDISWFNTYGSAEAERARTVLWGTGSGIVIGGQAKVNSAVGYIDHNFLMKTDTSGGVIWSKVYGPSFNISLAYSTALTDDGGYVMAGLTGGFGAQQNDVYLVKTNPLGSSGCNQSVPQMFSSAFTPTDSTGGTFINGGTEDSVTVIKTSVTVTISVQCNSTGVGIDEINENQAFAVYPNPANDFFILNYHIQGNENSAFSLFNAMGQKVIAKNLDSKENNLHVNTKNLPCGIYFWEIKSHDRPNQNGKIVIVR